MTNKKKENLLIITILSTLLVIFFYDVVFLNKTFKVTTANAQAMHYGVYGQQENRPKSIPVNGTDASVLEEPLYEFIKKNLKKGIFPLWNPHQALGYSLIGAIQVALFYPLNIFLYILPQPYAWDVFILVRLLFGGLFTYWMMRTFRFKPIPSLCSAIIFMLTGPLILLQYWTTNVEIIGPLLILAIERLINKQNAKNTALVAISFAMTFFGGHPEHIFFVQIFAGLFLIYRLFTLRKQINLKKSIFGLTFAYLLGLGISAIVLLPFLREFTIELWHGHPPKVGLMIEEVQERIISIVIPYFFQKENLTYDFTFAGWWGGYLGAIPLTLAFFGMINKQRNKLNYFFGILAFLIVSKAYGMPYINWIGHLPIFSSCRYAIHTSNIVALCIAVLAGMGVKAIQTQKTCFFKGLCFSILIILTAVFCLFTFNDAPHLTQSLNATLLTLIFLLFFQFLLFLRDKEKSFRRNTIAVLLVLLVAVELFTYVHRERPKRFDSFTKVPYIEFIKNQPGHHRSYGVFWSFYPNTATGYEVDDFGVFLGTLSHRYVEFVNTFLLKNYFNKNLRPPAVRVIPLPDHNPFLDLVNLQYIITHKDGDKDGSPDVILNSSRHPNVLVFEADLADTTKLVYSKEVSVYRRKNAFPRAFIVHRAVFEPNKEKLVKILKLMATRLQYGIAIEHPVIPEIKASLANAPIVDDSKATIIKHTPNEVVLDVEMENPGFLVLSDAYHPDWKVYVDGKKSKVFLTDFIIRSVYLKPGKHHVRFAFEPMLFHIGLIFAALSLLILSGYFFIERNPKFFPSLLKKFQKK